MNSNPNYELENFKNLKTVWKNTYDKILELKIINKRAVEKSKLKIFNEEKKKIDEKYNKKYKDEEIYNKITFSEKRNASNIEKIKRRNELTQEVIMETKETIKAFAKPKNQQYQELIKKLIVQSMIQMIEEECVVRVRSEDKDFVQGLFSKCESEYSQIMKRETGKDYECKLRIDEQEMENVYGGVHVFNPTLKIQSINDLESRLNLTYDLLLPQVKSTLYPERK